MAEIKISEDAARYNSLKGRDIQVTLNPDGSVTFTGASHVLKNTVVELNVTKEEFKILLTLPYAQRPTKIEQIITAALSKMPVVPVPVVPREGKPAVPEIRLPETIERKSAKAKPLQPREFTVSFAIGDEPVVGIQLPLKAEETLVGTCELRIGKKWLDRNSTTASEQIVKRITNELAYLDEKYYDEEKKLERTYGYEKKVIARALPPAIGKVLERVRGKFKEQEIVEAGGSVDKIDFKSSKPEPEKPAVWWTFNFSYGQEGKKQTEVKLTLNFFYEWIKEHGTMRDSKFIVDENRVFAEMKSAFEKHLIAQKVPEAARKDILGQFTINSFKGPKGLFELMAGRMEPITY